MLAPSMVDPPLPPPTAAADAATATDGGGGGTSVPEVEAALPTIDIEQLRRRPQMPDEPAAPATAGANIASRGEESLQQPVLIDEGRAVE